MPPTLPRRSPYARAPSRRTALAVLAAVHAATLAGCAGAPPPPKPAAATTVNLAFAAAADANPDARGRASPVAVRVYALRASAGFEAADFFALQEGDTGALGADLLQREELVLRPGERRALALQPPAGTQAIGVVVAYRDLDRARWRAVQPVGPGQAVSLAADIGARQVTLRPAR